MVVPKVIIFAMLTAAADAGAATYYVSPLGSDSGPGTRSTPFKSMEKADAAAEPGDTIHLAPGIYPGVTTTKNGTALAHIKWVSDTRWGAKIKSTDETLWWSKGVYVDITGFEVDGTGSSSNVGIQASGNGSSIMNNHVHHVASSSCPANGAAGILADGYYSATDIIVEGNYVHDIGQASCNSWLYHGLYFGAPNSVGRNNLVTNIPRGFGIHVWHDGRRVRILNNTLVNNVGGVALGGGDYYHQSSPAGGNIIANNIIVGSETGFNQSGNNDTPNIFTNNLEYKLGNRVTGSMRTFYLENGVQGDPLFMSATDFHLKSGSPAIGKASSSYAPITDYDGYTRLSSDIGAYEYKSIRE